MGKIINIISHNVKLAAHKSFYNLATMAVKGNTDNKFNCLSCTINCATGYKKFNCLPSTLHKRIKIKSWSLGSERQHWPKYDRKTKSISP